MSQDPIKNAEAGPLPSIPNENERLPTQDDRTGERPKRAGLARWIRSASTLLVLVALAGLGYWGHQTGWTIPKFSELTGSAKAQTVGWCDAHGVPSRICVSCNAGLMPKGKLYGWCQKHGVAECVLEHPELAQLSTSVSISQADLDRATQALATKERPPNDPLCNMHLRRIQFVSRAAADKAGIDIALVSRGRIVETIKVTGEIRYNPTLVTRLSARAAGTVWRVEKNVGDHVRQGDLLALIDATSVGRTKAELLQAVARFDLQDKNLKRLSGLPEGVVPGRRILETKAARTEAEAAVRKAIQTLANLGLPVTLADIRDKTTDELASHLHFLGLPAALSRQLDPQRTTANLVPILSPRDGVVVTRDVVAGEVVDPAKTLFTVVDNRRMWLLLNVPPEDVRYIAIGQKILFRPEGLSDDQTGELTWISTRIDAETRTVKVRAELANDDGRLRDESFGAGQIVLRENDQAIVAPNEAIHWEGCCHVAFVRDRNFLQDGSYKVFHTRMVRPGVTNGKVTEVIAGLLPGEVVVTDGSGILRAELLKGNLGAG